MPSVVITAGALFGARIPLLGRTTVGRLSTATIHLPSTQVSREHAALYPEGDQWLVEDLGSRNGTRVGDEAVTEPRALKPGDVVRFGEISMIFDAGAQLEPARYGEAWVLFASPELEVEPVQVPVGRFGGATGDLAGLSHLMAATLEEEGLVRGILQLVQDRLSASEVVLVRVHPRGGRLTPLGVVAPSGPVPVHLGLFRRAVSEGRAASLPRVTRTTLKAGCLERSNLGGPAMCAPLRLAGEVGAALYVAREPTASPFGPDDVARVAALAALFAPALDNARRAQLQRRRHRAWVEPEKSEGLLSGKSPLAQRLLAEVQAAAADDGPVLLVGEAGTGKERIARLVHAWSERWEGPLVQVSCSTASDSQLELLLFGRGGPGEAADPRLERAVVGKAALADGGTLYLDRIDTVSAAVQDRLLRLYQSGTLWRLKDSRPRAVDLRVIASSELAVEELVERQALRPELLALLAGRVVTVPPLSERLDDLEPLVEELVARISVRLGRSIRQVTDEAYEVLREREWPGNLRELEGVLTRAISYSEDEVLTGEDISVGGEASASSSGGGRLSDALRDSERRLLVRARAMARGSSSEAARILGMGRAAFLRRLRQLGLDR